MVRKLLQVVSTEAALEFAREMWRVFGADAESDEGPGIAEHRVPDVGLQLVQVLMGDRKSDLILALFGEHVRKRKRGEVLEFVDVDEKGFPPLCGPYRRD